MATKFIVKVRKGKVKKSLKKSNKYAPDNSKILSQALFTLVQELLPIAVKDYTRKGKKGKPGGNTQKNAYAVTNIISEVRGVIQQLDGLIDTKRVKNEINAIIAVAVRAYLSSTFSYMDATKESMRIKTKDSSAVKQMELLIDGCINEVQKNIMFMATEIDIQISNSINNILSPPKKRVAKKKKIKKKRS